MALKQLPKRIDFIFRLGIYLHRILTYLFILNMFRLIEKLQSSYVLDEICFVPGEKLLNKIHLNVISNLPTFTSHKR